MSLLLSRVGASARPFFPNSVRSNGGHASRAILTDTTVASPEVSLGANNGSPRFFPPPSHMPWSDDHPVVSSNMVSPLAASSAPEPHPTIVQVTRANFEAMLPVVQEALTACDFYAIDCEMTGLHLDGNTDGELDGFEERYSKLAANASQFLITQFGLSAFVWVDAQRGYQARTFNFWLFPAVVESQDYHGERLDHHFMCQASSLMFLASQGFDFNKMITQGVPFLSLHTRDKRLRALQQQSDGSSSPNATATSDAEAKQLADLRHQVTAWRDAGVGSRTPPLQLQPASDRIRSLQRTVLGAEFGASGAVPPASVGGIQVSEEQLASGEIRLSLHRVLPVEGGTAGNASRSAAGASRYSSVSDTAVAAVREAAGFCMVLEMMRDSKKPLVGHNMMCDLGFMMQSFVEPLPRTWPAFKALIGRWFPSGVYDTKHIALQLGQRYRQTDLASMYHTAVLSPVPGTPGSWPPVSLAQAPAGVTADTGFSRSRAHEAGFDAYMTGAVLARLARAFDSANASSPPVSITGFPGVCSSPSLRPLDAVRNRIHMMRTDLGHFALAGNDPIPCRPNVLHVSGFPAKLGARDVGVRFFQAGYGQARATAVASASGKAAALVELLQPENPGAVAARLQKLGWDRVTVQSFAEYYYAQQRRKGYSDGPASSSTMPSPGSPRGSPGRDWSSNNAPGPRGASRPLPQALPSQAERPMSTPPPPVMPARALRRLKISPPPGGRAASATPATESPADSIPAALGNSSGDQLPATPASSSECAGDHRVSSSGDDEAGDTASSSSSSSGTASPDSSPSASTHAVSPATSLGADGGPASLSLRYSAVVKAGAGPGPGGGSSTAPGNSSVGTSSGPTSSSTGGPATSSTATATSSSATGDAAITSAAASAPAAAPSGDGGKDVPGGTTRPSFAAVTAASNHLSLNAAQLAARLAALKLPKPQGGSSPPAIAAKPQRPMGRS